MPCMEVGDTFVPYMVVSFPRFDNQMFLPSHYSRLSATLLLFLVRRLKACIGF